MTAIGRRYGARWVRTSRRSISRSSGAGGRSRRQALDVPALTVAAVDQAVVHPAGTALPELDDLVPHPVAAPVLGDVHLVGEALLDAGEVGRQGGPARHDRRLARRPGP